MPLPALDLDTRRWTDLVDEARSIIPRNAPGWTDHNSSDPGITLLELLAYLVEQDIYRANRVPERHRRKFLHLAGYDPEPPRASHAIVSLVRTGASAAVPAGAPMTADGIPYRTASSLNVAQASIVALQSWDGAELADLTRAWRNGVPFSQFGPDPSRAGAPALLVGLDRTLPVGVETSFSVSVVGSDPGEAARIVDEQAESDAACRPMAPTRTCDDRPDPLRTEPQVPTHHSLRTVWEYHDGNAWQPLDPGTDDVRDSTRGLTISGWVRIRLPAAMAPVQKGLVTTPLCWLRCRVAGGAPDTAPQLEAFVPNAVEVVQREAVPVVTQPGTGAPEQEVQLPRALVADGTADVTVDGVTWAARRDLDAARPDDTVLVVDAERGLVRFGDGRRGRVPPRGSAISVAYETTAAAAGAVGATATWRFVDPTLDAAFAASGAGPSWGGAEAESVAHAQGRAAAALWAHERLLELLPAGGPQTLDQVDRDAVLDRVAPARAVTLADFERLALAVPGTRVLRARAWAALDPRAPCLEAPGTVTVVVLAGLPAAHPEPTRQLLSVVARYLDRRRMLGTRLRVVGASYVDVDIAATVETTASAVTELVAAACRTALQTFFDPLRGGPTGRGWPFGRDVYRTEILQRLDEVEGVDHVESLTLAGGDAERCDNVCVPPTSLVRLGSPTIEAHR